MFALRYSSRPRLNNVFNCIGRERHVSRRFLSHAIQNTTDKQSTVFSGIQPTGTLHIGNYLGAVKNWLKLQENHFMQEDIIDKNQQNNHLIFSIVDLHSLTTLPSRSELHHATRTMAATLIACGIDPNQVVLYNQSQVSGHSELAWMLGCLTNLGKLNMMTQFKEKKDKTGALLGLYSYPVLMAADILLFKGTHVPVGSDQIQHLELARHIAGIFNKRYSPDFFPIPQPIFTDGCGSRIMSLRDATKKMSKSDNSLRSRINLDDSADDIYTKIRKAKTDTGEVVTYERDRPEIFNLIQMFMGVTDCSKKEVCDKFVGKGILTLKDELADALIDKIVPIGKKISLLNKDPTFIDNILHQGAKTARELAQPTLEESKRAMGLY